MMEGSTMIGIVALIVALGFAAYALHRMAEAESARAIGLHMIGTIIPALERKGYETIHKLVSFGADPAVTVSMVGSNGLWIDMEANRHTAHFVIHSGTEDTDNPDLCFEVSGPWDELTLKRLASWERTFESWQDNGGRFASLGDTPGPFVTFYTPSA